jgi:hypothetical protein
MWNAIWTSNLNYLEFGRGRYCAGKEWQRIRKIWTRLSLWKPSSLLPQPGSRARQVGPRPKAPQGHKYNPLGAPKWWPIQIHSPESCQIEWDTPEEADGRRKSSTCLGDGLGHALAAMVGPMVKPWSSRVMPCIHQGNCTINIWWWYKSCILLTLIYFDALLIHMCS